MSLPLPFPQRYFVAEALVNTNPSFLASLPLESRVTYYALSQQARLGRNTNAAPGFFDGAEAKERHTAWLSLEAMPVFEAQRLFVRSLDLDWPGWMADERTRRIVEGMEEAEARAGQVAAPSITAPSIAAPQATPQASSLSSSSSSSLAAGNLGGALVSRPGRVVDAVSRLKQDLSAANDEISRLSAENAALRARITQLEGSEAARTAELRALRDQMTREGAERGNEKNWGWLSALARLTRLLAWRSEEPMNANRIASEPHDPDNAV
jgi:hypothetical protein